MGNGEKTGMERGMETDLEDREKTSVGHRKEARVDRGESTSVEDS